MIVVPMKKMIIRAIGMLLIVLGTIKAYGCLSVVAVFVPIVFEQGLIALGVQAGVDNIVMAGIGLGKVVGGFGLLWLKSWAKWVAIVAASVHALFLTYGGISLWVLLIRTNRTLPTGIPYWKDYVSITVNITIIIALFVLFRKPKETEGTTKPSSVRV